jgi:hypothetical protein
VFSMATVPALLAAIAIFATGFHQRRNEL